jgi:hypothetical protein
VSTPPLPNFPVDAWLFFVDRFRQVPKYNKAGCSSSDALPPSRVPMPLPAWPSPYTPSSKYWRSISLQTHSNSALTATENRSYVIGWSPLMGTRACCRCRCRRCKFCSSALLRYWGHPLHLIALLSGVVERFLKLTDGSGARRTWKLCFTLNPKH